MCLEAAERQQWPRMYCLETPRKAKSLSAWISRFVNLKKTGCCATLNAYARSIRNFLWVNSLQLGEITALWRIKAFKIAGSSICQYILVYHCKDFLPQALCTISWSALSTRDIVIVVSNDSGLVYSFYPSTSSLSLNLLKLISVKGRNKQDISLVKPPSTGKWSTVLEHWFSFGNCHSSWKNGFWKMLLVWSTCSAGTDPQVLVENGTSVKIVSVECSPTV